LLVLGAGDRAYVMWTRTVPPDPDTCGGPPVDDPAGTYVATDATGQWTTARLSRSTSPVVFTVEPTSGQVHAILGGPSLTYYTSSNGATWKHAKVARTKGLSAFAVRLDPTTGRVVVFASNDKGIYVLANE
jgi:hypothetical protein